MISEEKKRNEKYKFREFDAITLISLVITIIILIILAGIGINLSLRENSLFGKAKYAKEEYLNAQISEEKGINDLYSQIMIATNDNSQITISVGDLKKLIKEQVKEELSENRAISIDYNNLLTTITTQGASWTATEDCAVISNLQVKSSMAAVVCVEGVPVSSIWDGSATETMPSGTKQVFYVKKGETITTRENYGEYLLSVYGLK